jgi:hypothetical protein
MTQLEKGENRPKPEQDAKGRFVAGNSGNGGRPKGTRNELSEAFIADLCENWRKHGVSVIDKIRASQPVDYVKIIAAVVGRDANGGRDQPGRDANGGRDQPSVSIVNVITGVRG